MSTLRTEQAERMRRIGFVSMREAAELAGVSYASIHAWARDGIITDMRAGSARYVSLASLREHLGAAAAQLMDAES